MIGLLDFFFPCPLYFCPYSRLSSCLLNSVSSSHFILAVPMRKCLRKHSCMSSSFPIPLFSQGEIVLALAEASPVKI